MDNKYGRNVVVDVALGMVLIGAYVLAFAVGAFQKGWF